MFYNLFPNGVIVFHPDWITHLALQTVVPRIASRSSTACSCPPDPGDVHAQALRERSFAHIDGTVFATEDPRDRRVSSSAPLASGVPDAIVLGAREEGVRLFHRAPGRVPAIVIPTPPTPHPPHLAAHGPPPPPELRLGPHPRAALSSDPCRSHTATPPRVPAP